MAAEACLSGQEAGHLSCPDLPWWLVHQVSLSTRLTGAGSESPGAMLGEVQALTEFEIESMSLVRPCQVTGMTGEWRRQSPLGTDFEPSHRQHFVTEIDLGGTVGN